MPLKPDMNMNGGLSASCVVGQNPLETPQAANNIVTGDND